MRGVGFRCDECDRLAVEPGDRFVNYAAPLPLGWVATAISSEPHVDGDVHDFCGWDCVAQYARRNGTVAADNDTQAATRATTDSAVSGSDARASGSTSTEPPKGDTE